MKLLLTSAGIRNQSLADTLISLVGKPVGEITVGFIPTAANVEPGNKDYRTVRFTNIQKQLLLKVRLCLKMKMYVLPLRKHGLCIDCRFRD